MDNAKLDWAKTWAGKDKSLFIAGAWKKGSSGKAFTIVNPATEEKLSAFVEASRADVDEAVKAAKSAFHKSEWAGLSRKARAFALGRLAQIIRDHHAELATLESLCNGKTYRESYIDDMPEAADVFEYYAGWIDKFYGENAPVEKGFLNFTKHEPLGVCALIVPWNFPLLLACWKMAPALAMGNTVILKPSPFTSLSAIRFVELVHEAKILPHGVLNLVLGDMEAGEALSSHPEIAKLSFTGSTVVGKKVVEGAGKSNLKRLSLELGGKSANVIFDDVADLKKVVDRSFTAMYSHKGEKCSEPTRFVIHEKIFDRFVEAFVPKVEGVTCGDPFDGKTQQGPQCHKAHFEKVLSYVDIGKKEGAKLLCGGGKDPKQPKGYFIRPAVFSEVKTQMRIAQEEIFGPVLCLIQFRTEEEAIEIANGTPYGLAAGVYTADTSRAHRMADALDAGMVFVNHYGCYDFSSPFGGVKQSGWGKEMARQSLEEYTKLKSIWVRYG